MNAIRPVRFAVTLILSCGLAGTSLAGDELEDAYARAVEHMSSQRFAEAIPILVRIRKAAPENPNVIYNLGLAYAAVGRSREALDCWTKMCELEPGDWQHRAKIVQACQALGRKKDRDQAIAEVLRIWEEDRASKRAQRPWFCREQFDLKGRRVFGVQYFAPEPERTVYMAFLFLDAEGAEEFRISLGSYDSTNEIARATGEIGKDERLYHVDYYAKGEHRTYGFWKRKLEYEELRELAIKAAAGKLRAISSSTYPAGK